MGKHHQRFSGVIRCADPSCGAPHHHRLGLQISYGEQRFLFAGVYRCGCFGRCSRPEVCFIAGAPREANFRVIRELEGTAAWGVPVLTIFAGPNGSGKSSLIRQVEFEGRPNLLKPDAIARRIKPETPQQAGIPAGREVGSNLNPGRAFSTEERTSRAMRTLPQGKTIFSLRGGEFID